MVMRTLYGRAIERLVLRRLGFEDFPARKRASDINYAVLRWIDRHRGKPFFVFLNYMDTHDPYLPPQPYRSKFSKTKNLGGILNNRIGRSNPQITPEQLECEIGAYDGAISYVDDNIGQLLGELQKRDQGEKTLVVITSDHGESFGEHGIFLHGNSLYREEIHVPLILWWPGQVPAGVHVVRPVTNGSVPTTVMDLLGFSDQTSFPGPSLRQLWQTPEADTDWPYPLVELDHKPWAHQKFPVSQGSMKSLVSPHWHYIVHEKLGTELYDLENDLQELHNLAERVELRGDITRLRSRLPQSLPGR
jgi:arylsulfatase A-like enzyme